MDNANLKERSLPSYAEMTERGMVTASLVFASLLLVGLVIKPMDISNPTTSALATAGLIIASVMGGWCATGERDRAAATGVAIGLPLGFLFFQNSYARAASMHDVSTGAVQVMATAGMVGIIAGASGFVWRRFFVKHSPM